MSKNQPFWTDGKFEPKQNFKFRLLFEFRDGIGENLVLDIPYDYVISVDKPRFQVKEKISKLLNEERKFPTNVTWLPVSITLIDTVDNRLMGYLSKFINTRNTDNVPQTYFRIDEYNPNESFKRTATTADVVLQNIRIQHLKNEDTFALDGGSQVVEEWNLHSPWISNYEPTQVNYVNDNLSTYIFTISYNWATVEYFGNIPNSLSTAESTNSVTAVNENNRIGRQINQPLDFSDVAIDPYRSEPGEGWDPTVIGTNEYRSTIQRGRAGARTYGLEDSMTIREQPYPRTRSGRRMLPGSYDLDR